MFCGSIAFRFLKLEIQEESNKSFKSYILNNTFVKRVKMSDKPKLDLGVLEEDDEFEEFPVEDWSGKDKDEQDISVWEDNWEDDNVEDDFNKQLRNQLDKQPNPTGGYKI